MPWCCGTIKLCKMDLCCSCFSISTPKMSQHSVRFYTDRLLHLTTSQRMIWFLQSEVMSLWGKQITLSTRTSSEIVLSVPVENVNGRHPSNGEHLPGVRMGAMCVWRACPCIRDHIPGVKWHCGEKSKEGRGGVVTDDGGTWLEGALLSEQLLGLHGRGWVIWVGSHRSTLHRLGRECG
jgi:hypothetical protein